MSWLPRRRVSGAAGWSSMTTNNYGKSPVERAMILDDLAMVEPVLRSNCTHELDASRPLDEVMADLIAIASRPMARP
jgi:hypothetical protein